MLVVIFSYFVNIFRSPPSTIVRHYPGWHTIVPVAAAILLLTVNRASVWTGNPVVAWLGDLSAFRYAGVGTLIDRGTVDWVGIGVLAIVAVAGWTASLVLFRRRDLLP